MISVVIPTMGRDQRFLKETLEHVLRATECIEGAEIIVAENGGPYPNVSDLLRGRFLGKVKHVIFDDVAKVAESWNRTLALASRRWVHLLHDDDLVHTELYKEIDKVVSSNPDIQMLVVDANTIDNNAEPLQKVFDLNCPAGFLNSESIEPLCSESLLIPCSVFFNADALKTTKKFDNRFCYGLDWEFQARFAMVARTFYLPKCLVSYRIHQNNITNRTILSRAVYPEIQQIAISLHEKYFSIFGKYPSRSVSAFARSHLAIRKSHLRASQSSLGILDTYWQRVWVTASMLIPFIVRKVIRQKFARTTSKIVSFQPRCCEKV